MVHWSEKTHVMVSGTGEGRLSELYVKTGGVYFTKYLRVNSKKVGFRKDGYTKIAIERTAVGKPVLYIKSFDNFVEYMHYDLNEVI